jgi:rRNA biogenesis protein RRP5
VASISVGQVVKVRILSTDVENQRILCSIRQAALNQMFNLDVDTVEVGSSVQGAVLEVHGENAVLLLQPSKVKALLSLRNLANNRNTTLAQLRVSLTAGDLLDDLVVVSRNAEKGIAIVANKPKAKSSSSEEGVSLDSVQIDQIVHGRVARHLRQAVLFKLGSQLGGILHATDVCDNYDITHTPPALGSVMKAVVVAIDKSKRQLTLSTRASRMGTSGDHAVIVDPEIQKVDELQVGQTIRGFIKSVMDHGVFVTIGRDIDARVQIRELFDDVSPLEVWFFAAGICVLVC